MQRPPKPSLTRKTGSPYFVLAILGGMLLGGGVGAAFGRELPIIVLIGDLFLSGLKMLIIPLVVTSMITGVASLGDVRRLGRLGAVTFLYYLATTVLAVVIGITCVNLISPGDGIAAKGAFCQQVTEYSFLDVVRGMVPSNLFKAMADGKILPLIFFSLFFGAVLSTIGEKGRPVLRVVDGIFEVSMKMVHLVVLTAPIGVFALVATRIGKVGGGEVFLKELQGIGVYAATVITGLIIHGTLALGGLAYLLGRRAPHRLFRNLLEPLLLAFSTASSSATLPATMRAVDEKLKVDPRVGHFVLPLGATVNMDGTALYEAVAAIFIAQMYGIQLSPISQVVIALTATLAAIGAAGIPEAGLVTLVMVLHTAGLPVEGIGMLLAIDWFLDRCRTTINVWGDAVGTVVIERFAKLEDQPPTAEARP